MRNVTQCQNINVSHVRASLYRERIPEAKAYQELKKGRPQPEGGLGAKVKRGRPHNNINDNGWPNVPRF